MSAMVVLFLGLSVASQTPDLIPADRPPLLITGAWLEGEPRSDGPAVIPMGPFLLGVQGVPSDGCIVLRDGDRVLDAVIRLVSPTGIAIFAVPALSLGEHFLVAHVERADGTNIDSEPFVVSVVKPFPPIVISLIQCDSLTTSFRSKVRITDSRFWVTGRGVRGGDLIQLIANKRVLGESIAKADGCFAVMAVRDPGSKAFLLYVKVRRQEVESDSSAPIDVAYAPQVHLESIVEADNSTVVYEGCATVPAKNAVAAGLPNASCQVAPLRIVTSHLLAGDVVTLRIGGDAVAQETADIHGNANFNIGPLPPGGQSLAIDALRCGKPLTTCECYLNVFEPSAPTFEALYVDEPGPVTPNGIDDSGTIVAKPSKAVRLHLGNLRPNDSVRIYVKDQEIDRFTATSGEVYRTLRRSLPQECAQFSIYAQIDRYGYCSPRSSERTLARPCPEKEELAEHCPIRSLPACPESTGDIMNFGVIPYTEEWQTTYEILGFSFARKSTSHAVHPQPAETDMELTPTPVIAPMETKSRTKEAESAISVDTDFAFEHLPSHVLVPDAGTESPKHYRDGTLDPGKHPVFQHRFASPAHYPLPTFNGKCKIAHPDEGVVIYEGMRFAANSSGQFEVTFTAEAPAMPVEIRLQLRLTGTDGSEATVTLPPIVIYPRSQERSRSWNIRHVGFSDTLGEKFWALDRIERIGSCRFGWLTAQPPLITTGKWNLPSL